MQNLISEKPYEFVPPIEGTFWPSLIRLYVPRYLRNSYGVHSVECRHVERLRASIDAGDHVLLTPNHSRLSDPMVLGMMGQQADTHLFAMASWHLFSQDKFTRFMVRRMGAFSIFREGNDRQAINKAIDILVEGKRPLIIFPEGALSRHSDELMPLMDGPSLIARTAAKRRKKQGDEGGVVIHPVAIRYEFHGDLEKSIRPAIEEFEKRFAWHPPDDMPLIKRIRKIGEALLALKEIEYLGHPQEGELYGRVQELIEHVLQPLEKEWGIATPAKGVVARAKNLRGAILPDMIENKVTPEERTRRRHQLASIYYVQQISHYPKDYVRTKENLPERVIETLERFEEDFTDKLRVFSPIHAVLDVGEAIRVEGRRDRNAEVDPIMESIRIQLESMLQSLAGERTKVTL